MFNFYKINGYIYNKISNKNLFINQKYQEKILEHSKFYVIDFRGSL